MFHRPLRSSSRTAILASVLVLLAITGPAARAQSSAEQTPSGPTAALADALSAACRQDHAAFAKHLTAENATAFRALPEPQQTNLLKRFILLDDPGRPLLSTTAQGRTEVRCEAAGMVADMHFNPADIQENLAFVIAEIGQPGQQPRSVRIGFVREGGEWKLLSVGLLLLDLPELAKQWQESDLRASENDAIDALAKIAEALDKYQRVYVKFPDTLAQLGPPAKDGADADQAGLLSPELASGTSGGYNFRYVIVSLPAPGSNSSAEKADGFALTATPGEYGKGGRRSFYLDSNGTLRAADKHGAPATSNDPQILAPQPETP